MGNRGGGGDELDEVAEFRLAQTLGMEQDAPEFIAIWNAVYDLALAYLDDEPPDTPLSEPMVQDFELDGMPFHSFTVEFRQGVPLPTGWADLGAIGGPVSVQGRTKAEAMRTAMAAAPDRATVPNVLLSVRRA
jgi:hypothetical protein